MYPYSLWFHLKSSWSDVEQILLQQKHSEFRMRTTRPIGAQSPALIGPQRFLVEREAAHWRQSEGGGAHWHVRSVLLELPADAEASTHHKV